MADFFRVLKYGYGNFNANPKTIRQIYGQFGTLNDTINTTTNLKFYNLTQFIKKPGVIDNFCDDYSATIKEFSYDHNPEKGINYKVPNLKKETYRTGIVWIYNPKNLDGSFKDENYTRVWRVFHEIGHCITEPFLLARYGPSLRQGRLGRKLKGTWKTSKGKIPKEFNSLSIRHSQRAVEWESLAFRTQRILLEKYSENISNKIYQKEFNVNISDAIFRVITGRFGNPGTYGLIPHAKDIDLKSILVAIDDAAYQIPKVETHVYSDAPDLNKWMPVSDEAIKDAIKACCTEGIAHVHENWDSYDFYNVEKI